MKTHRRHTHRATSGFTAVEILVGMSIGALTVGLALSTLNRGPVRL